MPIPNWILEIADEARRKDALEALAVYEQAKYGADNKHNRAVRDAKTEYDRTMVRVRAEYDEARRKAREALNEIKRSAVNE